MLVKPRRQVPLQFIMKHLSTLKSPSVKLSVMDGVRSLPVIDFSLVKEESFMSTAQIRSPASRADWGINLLLESGLVVVQDPAIVVVYEVFQSGFLVIYVFKLVLLLDDGFLDLGVRVMFTIAVQSPLASGPEKTHPWEMHAGFLS
jgi:hypothetical protein